MGTATNRAVSVSTMFDSGKFRGLFRAADTGRLTCGTVIQQEERLVPKFENHFGIGNGRAAFDALLDLAAIRTGAGF